MTLIVPIGPPGCGKSTLVERLIGTGWLDADAVVSPDAYRRILTGDKSNQDLNGTVFGICADITKNRLQRGLDVFYDATNLLAAWRADILNYARLHNQPVMFILFTANNETCRQRNELREVPVPDVIMDKMFEYRRQLIVTDLQGHVLTDEAFFESITWSYPMSTES